jgi:hypothetical protein
MSNEYLGRVLANGEPIRADCCGTAFINDQNEVLDLCSIYTANELWSEEFTRRPRAIPQHLDMEDDHNGGRPQRRSFSGPFSPFFPHWERRCPPRPITLTFFLSTPGVAEATAGGFPAIWAAGAVPF